MKTAYVVFAGQYSDTRIVAVFDNREAADECASLYQNDVTNVEEWPMQKRYRRWPMMRVSMRRDGQVNWATETDPIFHPTRPKTTWEVWRMTHCMREQANEARDCLLMNISTDSEKRAIKVANEVRSRLIADNQWCPGVRS